MPEAYRPGLPVLSDEERLRRNAIQQEWSNPFKNESIDQRPSMASLYEDEPTTEELLAQAQGTLDSTAANARLVSGAGEIGRRGITSGTQSSEMHAPEPEYGYGDLARDTVVGASIPASFVPGPVGMVAGAIQGLDALAGGNPIGAGLAAIPAMRALKGAKGAASMGPIRKTGAEIGAKVSYPRAQATSMQIAGDLPVSQTPPIPSAPMPYRPASITALADDSVGATGSGSIDLTSALDDLGEAPLSPETVARARAAERFGRNFRSESTAAAPVTAGPKVRAFSEGEEQGIQNLGQLIDDVHGPDAVLGPGGRYMAPPDAGLNRVIQATFGEKAPASVSRTTARRAVELSDPDRAMLREGGAIFKGKKGDEKLSKWAMAEGEPDLPAAADEYLIHDMPATDWNARMFGGGSSSTEGTFGQFVRPKDRTPIGKRPARRGEGDEAIIWNPR